ncbi:MAG: cbb3-type cytochrome c oxidase subunit I [Verrucomicrobia bacterium]|nr:cbb3-type cytochrome c oxidase subunit I [Verrucomicrobiota bacterium]
MVAPLNPTIPPAAFSSATGNGTEPAASDAGGGCGGCVARGPILVLMGSGILWLVAASLLSLIASVKLHAPDFLGACPWFTYGHVKPAAASAFIFGFASQAGLGLVLWLICRLGKVTLCGWFPALTGAALWNLGVTYGVSKVLVSGGSGQEWLEFPHGASGLMMLGYFLIAMPALITFRKRQVPGLSVAQWYLLAALFFFPWLWVAGNALLVCEPVRGVVQITTGAWFRAGLLNLWLTPLALAVIYALLPAALGRPVRDRGLAAFAFWTLVLFGAWTGLAQTAPVPSWLVSLSNACTVAFALPVLAVAVNLELMLKSEVACEDASPAVPFLAFGALAFILGNGLHIFGAVPYVAKFVALTHYSAGVGALLLGGFVMMSLLGGLTLALPDLFEMDWPKPQLIRPQFGALAMGVALTSLALVVAGLQQGRALRHAAPFLDAVKGGQLFLVLASLGALLTLAGVALFALHFGLLVCAVCRECCGSCCGATPASTTEGAA